MLEGMPALAEEVIAAPDALPKKHSATVRISALLVDLISAGDLVRRTGLSRQRVDQVLKRLMHEGKAARVPEPGTLGTYLWLRTDINPESILHLYRKPLTARAARVLSCLSADTVHSLRQIAQHLDIPYYCLATQIESLTRAGLIFGLRLGRPKFVTITPEGLEHPARDAAASKLTPCDLTKGLHYTRAEFITALVALGEARRVDLRNAVLRDGRTPRPQNAGYTMRLLLRQHLVEEIECAPGDQARYRLTAKGKQVAEWIARAQTH